MEEYLNSNEFIKDKDKLLSAYYTSQFDDVFTRLTRYDGTSRHWLKYITLLMEFLLKNDVQLSIEQLNELLGNVQRYNTGDLQSFYKVIKQCKNIDYATFIAPKTIYHSLFLNSMKDYHPKVLAWIISMYDISDIDIPHFKKHITTSEFIDTLILLNSSTLLPWWKTFVNTAVITNDQLLSLVKQNYFEKIADCFVLQSHQYKGIMDFVCIYKVFPDKLNEYKEFLREKLQKEYLRTLLSKNYKWQVNLLCNYYGNDLIQKIPYNTPVQKQIYSVQHFIQDPLLSGKTQIHIGLLFLKLNMIFQQFDIKCDPYQLLMYPDEFYDTLMYQLRDNYKVTLKEFKDIISSVKLQKKRKFVDALFRVYFNTNQSKDFYYSFNQILNVALNQTKSCYESSS